MKNLVWLVVAALIALAGYMLFTGKGPQEVAIEASEAINAPEVAEDVTNAAEDAAEAMGINLFRIRLTVIIGTAAVVGASTAVAGAIGFVGLVMPHLLRGFVGARPGALLWAATLGGAAMILASDILVRLVVPNRDLKLGVVTALVGAPLFLHLIYRTRREGL